MPSPTRDAQVIDTAIRLLVLGGFGLIALHLMAPLFGLMLWAVILAVAVYPVHAWLAKRLGGRETLSAVLLTLAGLAITLGPVAVMAAQVIEAGTRAMTALQEGHLRLPDPAMIERIPLVGMRLAEAWRTIGGTLQALVAQMGPVLLATGRLVLAKAAGVGIALAMLSVSVVIMGLLFRPGPALVAQARRFANRIFAPHGAGFVDLAGATVRNVSRGVIGVAAIQALAAGIIMVVFGVPLAGPLTLAALFLGIIQIGPGPVLIPVIIWAWLQMGTVLAILFTVVMLPVMVVDNVLRPLLMARGLKTPMLVILVGVLGGMLAYGLVGLFIGPVILAVFYELVTAWVAAGETAEAREAPAEAPGDA
ncbi:AI-2E family transporter [Poseidonocella sp. HB161398]|uniref:AI-2E family transporter n=1 Tax=Poseidonocella sp. HB161398 TaxID=2320855 RepID=UPI001F0E4645|nr:AI-2E family transporter [Poseidonocella sp. HB161398]